MLSSNGKIVLMLSVLAGMAGCATTSELDSLRAEIKQANGRVVVANHNSTVQIVISGESEAVAVAAKFAQAKGAKTVPLPVSGARRNRHRALPAMCRWVRDQGRVCG